ncbi:hypothetical protein F5Y09DRAFT_353436 [Xylaria sp. FL1042]|nr:hypothetical protein F5Y09DRAFT_353436 [Xylaria sp. FL1042]
MAHKFAQKMEIDHDIDSLGDEIASTPAITPVFDEHPTVVGFDSDSLRLLQVVVRDPDSWIAVDDEQAYEARIGKIGMGLGDHHLLWNQVQSAYNGQSLSSQPFNPCIEYEVEHHVRNAFPNVVAEVVTPIGSSPILIAFVATTAHSLRGEFSVQAGATTHKISNAIP